MLSYSLFPFTHCGLYITTLLLSWVKDLSISIVLMNLGLISSRGEMKFVDELAYSSHFIKRIIKCDLNHG